MRLKIRIGMAYLTRDTSFSKMTPCVEIKIGNQKIKSKVSNGKQPVWDEEFIVDVDEYKLKLEIHDTNATCFFCIPRRRIGKAEIDFYNSIKMGNGITGFHSLKHHNQPAGKIQVDIRPC